LCKRALEACEIGGDLLIVATARVGGFQANRAVFEQACRRQPRAVPIEGRPAMQRDRREFRGERLVPALRRRAGRSDQWMRDDLGGGERMRDDGAKQVAWARYAVPDGFVGQQWTRSDQVHRCRVEAFLADATRAQQLRDTFGHVPPRVALMVFRADRFVRLQHHRARRRRRVPHGIRRAESPVRHRSIGIDHGPALLRGRDDHDPSGA
jgi:hypothetical protein